MTRVRRLCAIAVAARQIAMALADIGPEFDFETQRFKDPHRTINGARIRRCASGGNDAEGVAG